MNKLTPTSPDPTILRRAWFRWAVLTGASGLGMAMLLPAVGFLQIDVNAWLIAPLLWLLLAVPATIAVYGQYFRDDSTQSVTELEGYLHGVTSIWSVLTMGVALSLVACLLSGSVSPGIWPGALMLMLLVLARPSSG